MKILRKFLYKLFSNRIVVFQNSKSIAYADIMRSSGDIESYVKHKLTQELATELLNQGHIECTFEDDVSRLARVINLKIYILKK